MTTPADVLAVAAGLVGIGETPDGSNHAPPVTEWYYGWSAAWCAMAVSYCLAHGGFTADGGETLDVGPIVKTSPKGWAFVPYLAAGFRDAGRYDRTPAAGAIGVIAGETHTFLIADVFADGTVATLEGNYGNHFVRGRRRAADLEGFAHPPYSASPSPVPPPAAGPGVPPFPGTTRQGSTGPAVVAVQRRLADRGWRLAVDGSFGPATVGVVRGFQSEKRLAVDGVVGPITWSALWLSPVT